MVPLIRIICVAIWGNCWWLVFPQTLAYSAIISRIEGTVG